MATKTTLKAEETGLKILESALALRQEGFDSATTRDIAEATGAAYYYYASKDAIVMDFYQRSSEEMQPKIETGTGPCSRPGSSTEIAKGD